MKTILTLLFVPLLALAAPEGQGPRPAVTMKELPEYVVDAIRERCNDPDSLQIVSWTLPELNTYNNQGTVIGIWQISVRVRARNGYGGMLTTNYLVGIKRDEVLRCIRY